MTSRKSIRSASGLLLCAGLLLAAFVGTAGAAATITIINNDGAGEGFNDPAARAPVGGNPGVTLGQQRLNVFGQAASIWGSILTSAVPIDVAAQMNPQACNATSAVLGSAGPQTIHRDFAGAPVAGHWYHQALANKLSGVDLAPANPDITAQFNSQLDSGACLGGLVWYYGFDGNEGVNIEMLPVVLHELGHGLGFSTTTSGSTGNYTAAFPAIWDKFLYDDTQLLHWDQMTPAQRVSSAVNDGNLVWDGAAVTAATPGYLAHPSRFRIIAPGGIAGTYAMVGAAFGGQVTVGGVTGSVVLVTDAGGANANDGCEAITNAGAIAGNIALIDRGNCTFVLKASAAQAAGAIAVIIANNAVGLPPNPMGGSDPTITIPIVGISQADGATIKANLPGVTVTIDQDVTQPLAGADLANRAQLYAPAAFAGGSSVSHYDVRLTPDALMEPFINTALHNTVDLTRDLFVDIGWFPGTTATTLALFTAESRADGILVRWMFNDQSDVASITLERAMSAQGPWSPIQTQLALEGGVTTALDTSIEPGQAYFYHLKVQDRAGHFSTYGLASGERSGSFASGVFLGAPSPNPMSSGANVLFRISQPEYVRLSVLDASGRKVRTLRDGMMAPGQYTGNWDGLSDRSSRVAPGVYFLSLSTASGTSTQRIAVIQ